MKISFSDYKDVKFSSNLIALYLNRLLLQVAFNIVGIFLVIFFFIEFDNSITVVIAIFVAIHSIYALLIPLGAKLLARWGLKRLMITAVPFAFLATFSLFFWNQNPFFSLLFYITFLVTYKTLYWTPYHVDFAKFTDRRTRGRQVSMLQNFSQLILTASPFVGGAIIVFFGFDSLFLLSAAVFVIALFPLFFIERTQEQFTFGYFETFRKLFQKKHRPLLLAYAGDGAQTGITAVIWPIFIFILLEGKYLVVGAISSLTILILIIFRFIIGDIIDRWSKKKILIIGSILYTSGWIVKIFIETALQIFIFDTYHKAGNVINKTSFDTTTYDQAADQGHYIDEFTVLREIAINGGRVVMLVLVGVLISFFGIKIAFLVAAGATLFMTMLNKKVYVK